MEKRTDPITLAYENLQKKRQQKSENFFRLMVIIGCVCVALFWKACSNDQKLAQAYLENRHATKTPDYEMLAMVTK